MRTSSPITSTTHCRSNQTEVLMRTRHPSPIVLLFFLLPLTGAGCRDSGGAPATAVAAAQSPAQPTIPLPDRNGSFHVGLPADFGNRDQAHDPPPAHIGQLPHPVQSTPRGM